MPQETTTLVADQLGEVRERAYMAALGFLRDPEAARDAVQEASARSLRSSERFDPARPFYPWYYRILKNYCLDLLRRKKTRNEVGDGGSAIDATPAHTRTDAPLLTAERDAAIHRAMASLSEAHREILQLRHWQELSYDEIAQVLDVQPGTVMSRLYRARRALQDALNADTRWTR